MQPKPGVGRPIILQPTIVLQLQRFGEVVYLRCEYRVYETQNWHGPCPFSIFNRLKFHSFVANRALFRISFVAPHDLFEEEAQKLLAVSSVHSYLNLIDAWARSPHRNFTPRNFFPSDDT